jgi:hypothetical protein
MSTTTTTGTLTAGSSKTFNLAPGSAVSLTLSPNVRVTITETPESVSGSGVGGNTTRVHEPQLPGTFAYGPYAMGGVVVVAVASNSGSSVAWTRKDTVVTTDSTAHPWCQGMGIWLQHRQRIIRGEVRVEQRHRAASRAHLCHAPRAQESSGRAGACAVVCLWQHRTPPIHQEHVNDDHLRMAWQGHRHDRHLCGALGRQWRPDDGDKRHHLHRHHNCNGHE